MSIYIALDDDRLGPYTPEEVTQLVECGCLSPDDYAARDGDTNWVPLSNFLAPPRKSAGVTNVPVAPAPRRWRRPLLLGGLLMLTLVAVASLRMSRRTKDNANRQASAPQVSGPVFRATIPDARDLPDLSPPEPSQAVEPRSSDLPPATEVRTPDPLPTVATQPPDLLPPAVKPGGRVSGTISLAGKDGSVGRPRTLTVRVYLLKDLEPYLAQKKAAAETEIARLAPQIEAAEAERNTRVAAEQSARQALIDTSPSNELYASVQFAHQQAKGAIKTADDDVKYFRGQRSVVTSGEFYLYDLPPAVATAETDTRGEFTLDLPSGGPFAVVAADFQDTVEGTHARYWVMEVSFADANAQTLSLTDANTTSAPATASLIQTED